LVAISGVILVSPVALPAIVISIAGYVSLAGGIMSAIAQTAVKSE
jgi:hypothetical protein